MLNSTIKCCNDNALLTPFRTAFQNNQVLTSFQKIMREGTSLNSLRKLLQKKKFTPKMVFFCTLEEEIF